jgi:hypothetical protein
MRKNGKEEFNMHPPGALKTDTTKIEHLKLLQEASQSNDFRFDHCLMLYRISYPMNSYLDRCFEWDFIANLSIISISEMFWFFNKLWCVLVDSIGVIYISMKIFNWLHKIVILVMRRNQQQNDFLKLKLDYIFLFKIQIFR